MRRTTLYIIPLAQAKPKLKNKITSVATIITTHRASVLSDVNLFPMLSSDRKSDSIRDLERMEAINITWCGGRNFTDRFCRQIIFPMRGDLKITDMMMETAGTVQERRTEQEIRAAFCRNISFAFTITRIK
jgi:hypothetical protein